MVMDRRKLAASMEWLRPAGIVLIFFFAYYFGSDPVGILHILGPLIVLLMAGTISLESLFLGEIASEKIGYRPDRAYQVQSGLNNLATALTALMVFVLNWGKYADATILSVYLFFQFFSGINHARTVITDKNYSRTNIIRPFMTLILLAALIPHIVSALK